ncbi:MAG TPA: DNA primase [Micromonosporaceae bacterium]|nr:DNA primase [Micromonosporaceae bacterium]
MARKSSHRPDADKPETDTPPAEPDAEIDREVTAADEAASPSGTDKADGSPDTSEMSATDRALWEETRIAPIEIALPAGVGFTLRAYRLSTELTPTDIGERDEEDLFAKPRPTELDDEADVLLDEGFTDEDLDTAEAPPRRSRHDTTEHLAEEDDSDEDEDDVTEEEPEPEEVPVFLSHRGELLLFQSAESLVSFVRSGAPHDLAQLDTWRELAERIQPADITPLDEDSYELDLVVENLRGGHDAWDPPLLIKAGEAARDLGYALRLPSVMETLSPGSSLDDLDEALRATANGGFSGFLGRRRLKRIGAQTASLGWRTIIGKISAAVDWRD